MSKLFDGHSTVEIIYDNSSETVSAIRELIAMYIQDVKGGVITPDCDQNWKLTGYEIDAVQQEVLVQLLEEGKLTLPSSEDGRTPNVKALTWADVEAVQ